MIIGERVRQLREATKLSQGDVEKRTGLLRSYVSRVENGHTTPSLDTLQKMAAALEVPLYVLLYDGDEPPPPPPKFQRRRAANTWGASGKDALYLEKLRRILSKMADHDRRVVLLLAQRLASRRPNAAATVG